ncbi:MAG: hypothetical protein IJ975_02530 [Clostridia bacterium]|nr:hypothetical protein [Clostridia bacterium]
MAEKKLGGFRTFLLIVITIALAVVLSLAAYLMLVPNATIFGLKYASNDKKIVIEKVENDSRALFKFSDYSKIVVNADNHTNVKVTFGAANGIANSQIILDACTRGFMKTDAKSTYEISAVKNGTTLTITVAEPNYNFLQITNQTNLWLNVYSGNDGVSGATFEINTGSGSVVFGGAPTVNDVPKQIVVGAANVTTKAGAIKMLETTKINSSAALSTTKGAIVINGDKTIPNLALATKTGKITTNNIVGNVALKSYNSNITMGDITGNVDVEMESGILNFANINGNLVSENKLLYTTVKAKTITGEVTLVNDDGDFSVDIQKVLGNTSIRTANKAVKIGELGAAAEIQTKNGAINVKKAAGNTQSLLLRTTGTGMVKLSFDALLGVNSVFTERGAVTIQFGENAKFSLNASTQGRIYRTWLDSDENPLVNTPVGGEATLGTLTVSSAKGNIRIEPI